MMIKLLVSVNVQSIYGKSMASENQQIVVEKALDILKNDPECYQDIFADTLAENPGISLTQLIQNMDEINLRLFASHLISMAILKLGGVQF